MFTIFPMGYQSFSDGQEAWNKVLTRVNLMSQSWRLKRTDLLHKDLLRLIRDGASMWEHGRKKRTRQLWAGLVRTATSQNTSLGFIDVPDGGLVSLAEQFGVAPSTMSANLNRWRLGDHPMVVTYYGAKRTRHPPLRLVQLPDVTDLMVWAAEARLPYLVAQRSAPSLPQIADLLGYFAEHRATPGSPPETYDEAQWLLRRLRVRN